MADDTSNLINIDRLETFDTNLKNYIDTNSQASELLDEVVLLIEDNIHSGKAAIAQSVTNKGVPTTADQGYSEIAANIDSIKTGSGTAVAADVLTGKTFTNDSGTYTGSMTNNGAISGTVNCGGSYTIPAGYHNGSGKVTGNSLSSQTSATATAADILSGKTAYVNGTKLTGSITSKAAATITPKSTAQTISKGVYLSGDQTISGDSNLAAGNIKTGTSIFGVTGTYTSDATATAAQILTGQTAYVNGTKITGTMPNMSGVTNQWAGYATTGVQRVSDTSKTARVTIPNNNKHIGYCDDTSVVTGVIYNLYPDVIKKGVMVGRGPDHGADSTNTITGTYDPVSSYTQTNTWTVSNRTTLNAGTSMTGTKEGIIGQINIGTKPRCIMSKTINKSYVNNSSYWPFTIKYTVNGSAKTGYIYCQNTYANPNYMIFPGLNKYVYDDALGDITSSYFQSVSQGAGSYISLPFSTSSSSLSASFGRLYMYFSSDFTILYLYAEISNSSAYEFTNCTITPPTTLYLPMLV